MIATVSAPAQSNPIFLSEIFPITDISQPNMICFRLTPDLLQGAKDIGNRLSFHLSRQFPHVVVTWHRGEFTALAKTGQPVPSSADWRVALERVRLEVQDLSDRPWGIQWIRRSNPESMVLGQLACQILQTDCAFSRKQVSLSNSDSQRVVVRREAKFWSESVEVKDKLTPAISLSVRTNILFKGNLAEFFQDHPSSHNPEKLLIGLCVQSIEAGGHGIIRQLTGTVGEKREELIEWATGSTSRQALQDAPDEQPVVGIQFGKNPKVYEYAMAALRPRITDDTDTRFGVQYGQLLRATKIPLQERKELLTKYKEEASQALSAFGLQLESSVNSRTSQALFWSPQTPINQTPILFGKGYVGRQDRILTGLKVRNGGVFRRHSDYEHKAINIAVLKLCDLRVNPFLQGMQYSLREFGFESQIIEKKSLAIGTDSPSNRVDLEDALNEIAVLSPDVVLLFLPESDRSADASDGGSLYQCGYSLLLRRRIASQFVYADTLRKVQSGQILNQVVPGILAKLGNLPFVLAETLEIADYFIGLDISRSSKKSLPGTVNACASIRLYGKRGEFFRYLLDGGIVEGEEIPKRMIERLLPKKELSDKTVLVYRDGRFCGGEVENLVERATVINARIILVECVKSGVPRLYRSTDKILSAPDTGLALRLSSREAILVTTKVSPNVGLARPLRLRLHADGYQVPIEQVVETTLKLTLLHHGALKTPRLPMPLHGADRMAYLKLSGIYPSALEGDRQFWL